MSGKSYAQRKKVTFETDITSIQLEYWHNLIAQTQPDPSHNKEYTTSDAMHEEELEQIDQDEVDDLILDDNENGNPTQNGEGTEPEEPEEETKEDDTEDVIEQESTRRSTREIKPIERLEPSMSGKS